MQTLGPASPKDKQIFFDVLLPIPVDTFYTYILPDDLPLPSLGSRVVVPVGSGKKVGVIWNFSKGLQGIKLKKIKAVLDSEPAIPSLLRSLIEWTARYYLHPLGSVLKEALPPGLISSRTKGVEKITRSKKERPTTLSFSKWSSKIPEHLTTEQEKVFQAVMESISSKAFKTVLIHGVTGSGKTEVYLRASEHCLREGGQVLVLVPEIAMTIQTVGIFMERFGTLVTVLHSGLTEKQRLDQWRKIRTGEGRLIVGTRSAIFAPVSDLGLIIVDEEHDPSYKQTEKLRYNARDLAIVRGKMTGATVVLGSATPSIQSYWNAKQGKYQLLTMNKRVMERPLPEVAIIDRRKERWEKESELPRWMTPSLYKFLCENVQKKEQSLIFLNRRGFATYVFCPDCGHVFKCPHCEISLTWHRSSKKIEGQMTKDKNGQLLCHYCGIEQPALPLCPSCKGHTIKTSGFGTERIVSDLKKIFPDLSIARLDKDTASKRKIREETLHAFRKGEIDILVGTQMITKGHDFPKLTLVGIVWADLSLNFPDYISSERTFQLLSQVAGRAGRSELSGKVLIQTWLPNHYSIQMAANHDFKGFYNLELALRREHSYPPFSRFIRIIFSGRDLTKVEAAAAEISSIAQKYATKEMEILGPTPSAHLKLKGKYRYQLLMKSPSYSQNRNLCTKIFKEKKLKSFHDVKIEVDVDPLSLL